VATVGDRNISVSLYNTLKRVSTHLTCHMRYYHGTGETGPRLLARHDGRSYDLTAVKPGLTRFVDLCEAASVTDRSIDDIARGLLDSAEGRPDLPADVGRPVRPGEVWAAGVTYRISEEAREAESGMPEVYLDVYSGERPEVFFKATPNRTVGPNEAVGIRADSTWDVPEPELGVVVYRGEIVGYTIGNDMSSRSIEGENPLYLPQAKVYDRCCAIGPCIASVDSVGDPHDLRMSMRIERDGETMYDESTSTSLMVRTCEELLAYYARHNDLPEMAVLLTGTSLVPDEGFTLEEGDEVAIEIERIGTLRNDVVTV
jgi:2-dehydro-3-deoxy-D-arabinonate dehydratase